MKELTWLDTRNGPVPNCAECIAFILAPEFEQSVNTQADIYALNPLLLAATVVAVYHDRGHTTKR